MVPSHAIVALLAGGIAIGELIPLPDVYVIVTDKYALVLFRRTQKAPVDNPEVDGNVIALNPLFVILKYVPLFEPVSAGVVEDVKDVPVTFEIVIVVELPPTEATYLI